MKFIKSVVKEPIKKPIDLTVLEMAGRPKKSVAGQDVQSANPDEEERIPEFKPSGAALKQTVKMFENIFNNMKLKQNRKQYAGLMLGGDPGTGKTTRIALLSKILGINLITVEAPHIVEEHIINIPFIVFNSETGQTKGGSTSLKTDEYKVVLADSNLYSQIKHVSVIPDEQHLKNIYKQSKDIIELFEALGGTPDELPEEISELRKQYSVILFLDEYFRNTSTRIRNILRGILNGNIGSHTIPANTFIIYASNLADSGLDDIPMNAQFQQFDVKAPSKKEWFSWLVYKFEKDSKINLNKSLINRFHHILDDEHISFNDIESEVRTSPRRWEQLLLYINSSLPVKDEKDAKNLLTNVKINFTHYLSGKHSSLADKVLDAVAKLIKETSNIEISPKAVNEQHEWRDTLTHQIEQKMKLGEHRKYVPVISGPPGIGKTAQVEHAAKQLNLRYIDIDVSTLNPEDTIGLPLPKRNEKDDKIETTFSIPSLYYSIKDQIKEEDRAYLEKLKTENPDNFEELKKQYEEQEYKYLIFFDELNRGGTKVFNAIRRVLLEKNFGPSSEKGGKLLELPKGSIMVAAINPDDVGTEELTSHMQDVLDIIPSKASWPKTVEYLKDQKLPGVEDSVHDLALDIVKTFVDKFETKDPDVPLDLRPFTLEMGGQLYISPREYDMLFLGVTQVLDRQLKKIWKKDLNDLSPDEIQELEDDLREALADAFELNISFNFTKHNFDKDAFIHDLKHWIMTSNEIDFGDQLFFKRSFDTSKKENSLIEILGQHFDNAAKTGAHKNVQFINFMNNVDLPKFSENLISIASDRIKDEASAKKYVLDDKYARKELDAENSEIVDNPDEKVSLLENFMREVIYALHIHQYSNDKISAVVKAISLAFRHFISNSEEKGLSDEVKEELIDKVVMLKMDVIDEVIDTLPE